MRSDYIIDWAVQTGLSVTFLVVFILLIRRPFAKRFGAKAAYALWLLPVLRLFIPTITVPRIFPETAVTGLPEATAVLPSNVTCLLYTSPSPRDGLLSRMPSSA